MKWKQIAGLIREDILSGRLAAGAPLPSETELARQYGVCRVTAHRAMFELQRQGLLVRKRRVGTFVAPPPTVKTVYVAAVFSQIHLYPQAEYLRGVRSVLPDNYHLLFYDTHDEPQREMLHLRRVCQEADGIIWYPTCFPDNTAQVQRLIAQGKPLVCVDRMPEALSCDAVMTDNYNSSRVGLRYLAQKGHRNIAHFTADRLYVSSIRDRYRAYVDTMHELGISDVDTFVRLFPPLELTHMDYLVQAASDALFTLLHQPHRITAVFCLNDYYMAAALEACERMGIFVPDELEVLSFADVPPLVTRVTRSVHRIRQQVYEMGRVAGQLLKRRLSGEVMPSQVITTQASFYIAGDEQPSLASVVGQYTSH